MRQAIVIMIILTILSFDKKYQKVTSKRLNCMIKFRLQIKKKWTLEKVQQLKIIKLAKNTKRKKGFTIFEVHDI